MLNASQLISINSPNGTYNFSLTIQKFLHIYMPQSHGTLSTMLCKELKQIIRQRWSFKESMMEKSR